MNAISAPGTRRMVRFNWPDYVVAAAVVLVALVASRIPGMPDPAATVLLAGAALAAWWIGASLIAAWWLYDRSELYAWRWVTELLTEPPRRWLNVTTGFDESSVRLEHLLGGGRTTIDVYDAARMTEASIRRARASRPAVDGTVPCPVGRLPFPAAAFDAAFVIFAAHEVRLAADRAALFAELRRVVREGGEFVLVEHPRNLANRLVFGPGAGHFLPRREWLRQAAGAGFELRQRASMTPFVEALAFDARP